jgi:hypothetical protein
MNATASIPAARQRTNCLIDEAISALLLGMKLLPEFS